ncbi:10443_t:CDS:1, partial [Gigaspora margarita]
NEESRVSANASYKNRLKTLNFEDKILEFKKKNPKRKEVKNKKITLNKFLQESLTTYVVAY